MRLSPYDIVVIAANFEDEEVRGKRGYIISDVTDEQVGIFVYDLERVWCLSPSDVKATGEQDNDARFNKGAPIRVSRHGDIID